VADAVVLPPDRILVFLVGEAEDPQPVYHVTTDTWSWLSPNPMPPFGVGSEAEVALATDGFVYQFEGAADTTAIRYDPVADAWDPESVASFVDLGVSNAIAQLDGSILLVTGGSASLVSFDPATSASTVLMTEALPYGWAEPMSDGRLLAMDWSGQVVVCVDPLAGTAQACPTTPIELGTGSVGAGPDGRIYAVSSGEDGPSQAWAFDDQTRAWGAVQPPTVDRGHGLLITGPDDRLYLVGGGLDDPTAVEVFEPTD
jgi:hypothetical protein